MLKEPPKISVYIPCYNAARTLAPCIEGVLNQTIKPDEILVIDDGSTDNTAGIARRYPEVTLIQQPRNLGLGAGRNKALETARNDLVACVDADVVAHPAWLEKLIPYFKIPKIAMVSGMLVETVTHNAVNRWRAFHLPQHHGVQFLKNPPIIFGCNSILRKRAALQVGGYSEKFRTNGEDMDFYERLRTRGYEAVYTPEVILCHLRQDNLRSLLRTAWRWNCYAHQHPVSIKNNFLVLKNHHWRRLKKFIHEDWRENHRDLILITLIYFIYAIWSDGWMWIRAKWLKKPIY